MWHVRDLLKKNTATTIYVVQCWCWWWLLFANKSFSEFLNQAKRSYESGNYSDGVWIYTCWAWENGNGHIFDTHIFFLK